MGYIYVYIYTFIVGYNMKELANFIMMGLKMGYPVPTDENVTVPVKLAFGGYTPQFQTQPH